MPGDVTPGPVFHAPQAVPTPNPVQDAFAQIRSANAAAHPPQAHMSPLVRALMMLAQGADSINTANFLKHPGTYETDPLMKPFAQAGNPLPMLGAYAAEDSAISHLPSTGQQNTAGLVQLLLNILGIAKTQQSRGHFPKSP